jgi:hypothetical protein
MKSRPPMPKGLPNYVVRAQLSNGDRFEREFVSKHAAIEIWEDLKITDDPDARLEAL